MVVLRLKEVLIFFKTNQKDLSLQTETTKLTVLIPIGVSGAVEGPG